MESKKRKVIKYFGVKFWTGYLGFNHTNPNLELSNDALTPHLFLKKKDAIKAGQDFINMKFDTEGASQISFVLEKVYQIEKRVFYIDISTTV